MIRIAFRLDDPSGTSDHALERAILERLRARGMRVTLAVVPFAGDGSGGVRPLSAASVGHIREAAEDGTAEIALHGFSHERRNPAEETAPSEFAGLAPERQEDLMRRGLAHLQAVFGRPIRGFVPPWNAFDAATLNAARRLGISYVSAGRTLPRALPPQVPVIPLTCRLDTLGAAIGEARRIERLSPIVVVILHHYDFFEHGGDGAKVSLDGFDASLARLASQPDVVGVTLEQLAARIRPRRMMGAMRLAESLRRHPSLPLRLPRYCIAPGPLWRTIACGIGRPERGR
ncbi:MAG: hypothetical protein Fur0039_21740 [Rhodocyclaceae bacterium]